MTLYSLAVSVLKSLFGFVGIFLLCIVVVRSKLDGAEKTFNVCVS